MSKFRKPTLDEIFNPKDPLSRWLLLFVLIIIVIMLINHFGTPSYGSDKVYL